MNRFIKTFESFKFGSSNSRDIMIELEENGWDISGLTARKYFSYDEKPREVIVDLPNNTIDNIIVRVIDQDSQEEIDRSEIDAEGYTAFEFESEIWKSLSLS
tara:strand:+ start:1625 stop:1930 length:306 start_codon:yes stop_codon:yes gene_type:complete